MSFRCPLSHPTWDWLPAPLSVAALLSAPLTVTSGFPLAVCGISCLWLASMLCTVVVEVPVKMAPRLRWYQQCQECGPTRLSLGLSRPHYAALSPCLSVFPTPDSPAFLSLLLSTDGFHSCVAQPERISIIDKNHGGYKSCLTPHILLTTRKSSLF